MAAQPALTRVAGAALARRVVPVTLVAGLLAFLLAGALERRLVRLLARDARELGWISDVVLSLAFMLVTYLWLHLRATQMRISQLEREQIALDTQLGLAAEIQRGLLPRVPEHTPGFTWAAAMEPAGRIGGDFYDVLQPERGSVLLIVGDISGKGVPAALLLSATRTMFRSLAHETREPALLATRLAEALFEETGSTMYVTGLIALVQSRPARVTYANAGHPPGLLVHGAALRRLATGGPPLGLLPVAAYEQATLELAPGELGVFVTDGVTEALEGEGVGLDDVLLALVRAEHGGVAGLRDAVMARARAGPGPPGVPGWQDDRTVLVFRADAE